MKPDRPVAADIGAYIAAFPAPVRTRLRAIRSLLASLLPDAQQKISYGMPTFVHGRVRIHFAAFSQHIGLYPGPAVLDAVNDDLAGLRTSKGTVQFDLAQPLPLDLIAKIVQRQIADAPAAGRRQRASAGS
jgi:uncharacterized protein YdhG (YjbR/CyaY superfamily)